MKQTTNPANFITTAQGIRPCGAHIPKFGKIFGFGGPISPPCTDGVKFGVG